MARISKKRFNLRLYILAIALTALAVVGVLMIVLYSNGWRYQTYDTSNHGKVKFVGKFEENVPASGTVYYADGSTAKVLSGGSDKAASADTGLTVWKLKLQYANGDVYEGQTVQFLRHGSGKLAYSGGDTYEGAFHFDDMEGKGSYTYLSGDRYVGEFSKNQKHGKGTYTWAPQSDGTFDTYEGEYVTGKRCGTGVYTWADGTRYEGEFAEDAKDGKGKITFPDGATYEGDFIADTRTGNIADNREYHSVCGKRGSLCIILGDFRRHSRIRGVCKGVEGVKEDKAAYNQQRIYKVVVNSLRN